MQALTVLQRNNYIIGKLATDRNCFPSEYDLRDPWSAELQSDSRSKESKNKQYLQVNIKSVILHQTTVLKVFTFSIFTLIMLQFKYKSN